MEHLFDQPLEVGQAEIDTFLGHNTHIMRAYYDAFNTAEVGSDDSKHGWEGIYISLQVQIQRTTGWSIDPTLTEEQRADARRKGHMIIKDLCNVAIYFKHKISKDDLTAISRLLYMLRFMHPIGEALVEEDMEFKDYVVRAISTIDKTIARID